MFHTPLSTEFFGVCLKTKQFVDPVELISAPSRANDNVGKLKRLSQWKSPLNNFPNGVVYRTPNLKGAGTALGFKWDRGQEKESRDCVIPRWGGGVGKC